MESIEKIIHAIWGITEEHPEAITPNMIDFDSDLKYNIERAIVESDGDEILEEIVDLAKEALPYIEKLVFAVCKHDEYLSRCFDPIDESIDYRNFGKWA